MKTEVPMYHRDKGGNSTTTLAEPKKKSTRRGRRIRYHLSIPTLSSFIICPKCGSKVPPHMVCPDCGYYKGVKIYETRDLKARKKLREEKGKKK